MVNYISKSYYLYAKKIKYTEEDFKEAIIEYKHNKNKQSLFIIKEYLFKAIIYSARTNKYLNSDIEADDLIGNIYLKIEKILNAFNAGKTTNIVKSFMAYFYKSMHNRSLTDVIFKIKGPYNSESKINKNILKEDSDEEKQNNIDDSTDIYDFYKYIEERDLINELINNLNEKDGGIVKHYLDGNTWDKSSELVGKSGKIQYATREKIKKILKKLMEE